jgi:nucleotide-binding universal stress UspA family protein
VHAIRQFTQQLGHLSSLPATLLHIKKNKEEINHSIALMQEYLSINYQHLRMETREGLPEEVIFRYAEQNPNPLIVMGAYGRSAFSRFFSRSTAGKLLKEKSMPVFAAH